MTADITLKISYLHNSRFASLDVKQFYSFFLFFRPIMLVIMTIYNLLLGLKTKLVQWEKDHKKFKEDIAFQRELAQ